jgi:hypothetical protein
MQTNVIFPSASVCSITVITSSKVMEALSYILQELLAVPTKRD